MKAAPFEYIRPGTLEEAVAILAADEDARPVSGGQTLTPMMAMRLARPSKLVDIARLPELSAIEVSGKEIRFGASIRQAVIERNPDVAAHLPLLAAALPWVGHIPTRNRGTIGGSVANADPAAEIPLVVQTLQGSIDVKGPDGERTVPAEEFFLGPMMTIAEQGELVVGVRLPVWSGGAVGVGFHEISARKSDFAYVSAAAQIMLAPDGSCARCALGVGGAPPAPARLDQACAALEGTLLADSEIEAAVEKAVAGLEVMSDGHATPAYRRRVARALAIRALRDARDSAKAKVSGVRS